MEDTTPEITIKKNEWTWTHKLGKMVNHSKGWTKYELKE